MTVHSYRQGRVSLGYTPIGKGASYAKAAYAAHVNEVAGPVVKVGSGWEWTPPGETTRRYRTKRDAVAARDEL